jgi:hypothetical protein
LHVQTFGQIAAKLDHRLPPQNYGASIL